MSNSGLNTTLYYVLYFLDRQFSYVTVQYCVLLYDDRDAHPTQEFAQLTCATEAEETHQMP